MFFSKYSFLQVIESKRKNIIRDRIGMAKINKKTNDKNVMTEKNRDVNMLFLTS